MNGFNLKPFNRPGIDTAETLSGIITIETNKPTLKVTKKASGTSDILINTNLAPLNSSNEINIDSEINIVAEPAPFKKIKKISGAGSISLNVFSPDLKKELKGSASGAVSINAEIKKTRTTFFETGTNGITIETNRPTLKKIIKAEGSTDIEINAAAKLKRIINIEPLKESMITITATADLKEIETVTTTINESIAPNETIILNTCDLTAYKGNKNIIDKIDGDFIDLLLQSGKNEITIDKNNVKIVVKWRDKWL